MTTVHLSPPRNRAGVRMSMVKCPCERTCATRDASALVRTLSSSQESARSRATSRAGRNAQKAIDLPIDLATASVAVGDDAAPSVADSPLSSHEEKCATVGLLSLASSPGAAQKVAAESLGAPLSGGLFCRDGSVLMRTYTGS